MHGFRLRMINSPGTITKDTGAGHIAALGIILVAKQPRVISVALAKHVAVEAGFRHIREVDHPHSFAGNGDIGKDYIRVGIEQAETTLEVVRRHMVEVRHSQTGIARDMLRRLAAGENDRRGEVHHLVLDGLRFLFLPGGLIVTVFFRIRTKRFEDKELIDIVQRNRFRTSVIHRLEK